jgi:hypothetical protein
MSEGSSSSLVGRGLGWNGARDGIVSMGGDRAHELAHDLGARRADVRRWLAAMFRSVVAAWRRWKFLHSDEAILAFGRGTFRQRIQVIVALHRVDRARATRS